MKKNALILSATLTAALSPLAFSAQTTPAGPAVDCSQLTLKEQSFASQLVDTSNQMMFCKNMTPAQRSAVMNMAQQPDGSGNLMTADQAVQQYMIQNSMTPSAPTSRPSSGGGCPVK